MFFVLIGIVILFVSFIIALFSLVHEQDGREEPYLASPRDTLSSGEPVAKQELLAGEPVLAENEENQDVQQQEAVEAVSDSVGPFPWEVVEGGDVADLGQAQSLTDQLIDQAGGDGQGREISGGFSVSDLQRDMD